MKFDLIKTSQLPTHVLNATNFETIWADKPESRGKIQIFGKTVECKVTLIQFTYFNSTTFP